MWGMTRTAQQVLQQALRLPPRARADIASVLLHSLDDREDRDVEAAWALEIERRLKDVESGSVKLLPWEQVRRSLRSGLRRAKPKA